MQPDREHALERLETAIGYRFGNRELLNEALTHRSFLNEAKGAPVRDNQRLEFFGDAVLGFLVSRRLMDLLPASCEGSLSRMRASLVDEDTLSSLAERIDLGDFLVMGRGEEKTGGRRKKSVLADAFEALVAAVYLDGGVDRAAGLVEGFFGPLLSEEIGRAHV
jgi:ribonuclease-3